MFRSIDSVREQADRLAIEDLKPRRGKIETDQKANEAAAKANKALGDVLKKFEAGITNLADGPNLRQHLAVLSNDDVATVKLEKHVQADTFEFSIVKLATSQQTRLHKISAFLSDSRNLAGHINIQVGQPGSASFVDLQIDLTQLSGANASERVRALSRAINDHPSNKGGVSASVFNNNGTLELMLSGAKTGKDNAFEVSLSTNPALSKQQLGMLVERKADDAKIKRGRQDFTSASNEFELVEGVKITLKKMPTAVKDRKITLNIKRDIDGTATNLEKLLTAYNDVQKQLDAMTKKGNPEKKEFGGAFASDAGVRQLRYELDALMKSQTQGVELSDFGVERNRDGTFKLDRKVFEKQYEKAPEAIAKWFGDTADPMKSGSAVPADTGVAVKINSVLDRWLDKFNGHLKLRGDDVEQRRTQLSVRIDAIERQFQMMRDRYAKQFTRLFELQQQFKRTSRQMDAMWGTESEARG